MMNLAKRREIHVDATRLAPFLREVSWVEAVAYI